MSPSPHRRPWIANLDMYRKVPVDLMEGTKEGKIISWVALMVMLTLFLLETRAFFTTGLETELALDQNDEPQLRVNFNITMMDLKCDYATVNVMSVFQRKETAQLNITQTVRKYAVDENQVRQQYMHRNMEQHDIEYHDASVTSSLEDMIWEKDRVDTYDLEPWELEEFLKTTMFIFVDYFASWCSHCQVLAPTWELLAEVMRDAAHKQVMAHNATYTDEEYDAALEVQLPVMIAKIDCVEYHEFCVEQGIMAYPTLRLFVNGKHETEYHGDRTIVAMTQFLKLVEEQHREEVERKMHQTDSILEKKLNISKDDRASAHAMERDRHAKMSAVDQHPGCMLTGFLLMNRAPGNFYIQAQSKHHDLAPHMTNVSHKINHLSFGDEENMNFITNIIKREKGIVFPESFLHSTKPMDDNVYVTQELHQAYHHYIKLVATNMFSYQVVPSSELAKYRTDAIPEAKFVIDLSPISVTYRAKTRRWYDYITSLMAIIGGTFTVVGMVEAGLRRVTEHHHHVHGGHAHKY